MIHFSKLVPLSGASIFFGFWLLRLLKVRFFAMKKGAKKPWFLMVYKG